MSILDEVSFGYDKTKIVCGRCGKVMVEGFEPELKSTCKECQEAMDWEGEISYEHKMAEGEMVKT